MAVCRLCVEGENRKEGLTEETSLLCLFSKLRGRMRRTVGREMCVRGMGWERQVERIL